MTSTFLSNLLLFAKPDVDNNTFVYLVADVREKYKAVSERGGQPHAEISSLQDKDLQDCHRQIVEYLKNVRGVFDPEKTMDLMLEQVRTNFEGSDNDDEKELTFSAPFDGCEQGFKAIFNKEFKKYFVSNDDSINITIKPSFDEEIKSEKELQSALNQDDQTWAEEADNLIRANIKGASEVSMSLVAYDGYRQFKKHGTVTIEINFDFTMDQSAFDEWVIKYGTFTPTGF